MFFFFNDTATTEIYTLPLHDALPISRAFPRNRPARGVGPPHHRGRARARERGGAARPRPGGPARPDVSRHGADDRAPGGVAHRAWCRGAACCAPTFRAITVV